ATVESLPPESPIPIFLILMFEFLIRRLTCFRNSLWAFLSKDLKKQVLHKISPEYRLLITGF
ncbi:MAG: hypothetical protein VYB85_01010, partial [Candidatus Thermoplasmatota archaeon]|nr:hypothetical protein [Candidatus Thermoplasmatota archaeon]